MLFFFFSFIHTSFFFPFTSAPNSYVTFSCIFWCSGSSVSLCIISVFLFNPFNSICKQIHSYRHHAILVLIPCHISLLPRHATLLSSFFFSSAAHFSLLLAGKCSVDFVIANLFSDLSLTPPVFSCIERSHYRSLMLAFAPFPLSIPRIALYVVVLVLHLHPPLRFLSLTVSANIPRCPSPHVIVHDALQ